MRAPRTSSARRHGSYRRQIGQKRPCNLCKNEFVMRSPFDRFCSTCKAEKDIFRFAEWLPNLSMAM